MCIICVYVYITLAITRTTHRELHNKTLRDF